MVITNPLLTFGILNPETGEIENAKDPRPTTTPKPTNRRTWNAQPQQPTYTAPDGSVHTGMTQEQFDQRQREYQMDNQIYQDNKARQRERVFNEALAKYSADPSSFTEQQKQALLNLGRQLGKTPTDTVANIVNGGTQQPTTQQPIVSTSTPTQTPQPGYGVNGDTIYSQNFGNARAISPEAVNDKTQGGANQYGLNYI